MSSISDQILKLRWEAERDRKEPIAVALSPRDSLLLIEEMRESQRLPNSGRGLLPDEWTIFGLIIFVGNRTELLFSIRDAARMSWEREKAEERAGDKVVQFRGQR